MIKLISILCLLFISNVFYAQLIKYEIKLKDVTTRDQAKVITDPIRETFNNFKEPYKFQVKFDAQKGIFEILSNIFVDEAELTLVLDKHGQTLIFFNTTKL